MATDRLRKEIGEAISAHLVWKQRLEQAVRTGQVRYSAIVAASDRECAFGKWLHGPALDPQVSTARPFAVVHRLHAGFHRSAGQVLTLVEQGRIKDAQLTLSREFEAQSDLLVRALQKWRRELMG